MNINIPPDIDAAKAALGQLGSLLTATEWSRAAIVYAFTRDGGQGEYQSKSARSALLTTGEFAALGIAGLASDNNVRAYRTAWKSAMLDGAPGVQPGDTIEVPSLPWKSAFGEATPDVQRRVFKKVLRDPQAFAEAVSDPDVADLVAERVASTPATEWRADAALREQRQQRAQPTTSRQTEARVAVEKVIHAIETFFDTEIVHNGQTITYRDVIRTVAESGDARELYRLSIVPTPLGVVLRRALTTLAEDATSMAGEFEQIGTKEIEA